MASAELTGACLKDAKAQCPGVQAGGGKIRDCLKTHIKDLSDDCKAVLVKAVNVKACADDAKKYCADVKAGGARVYRSTPRRSRLCWRNRSSKLMWFAIHAW